MTRRPKKSEMLEVRLSHEDKVALRREAEREGRTVSAVVRGLIGEYIREAESARRPLAKRRPTMFTRPLPLTAAASGVALFGGALLLTPAAHADDIRLALAFEHTAVVTERGEQGQRTRRGEAEVHLDGKDAMCLSLDGDAVCDPATLSADGLAIVVSAAPDPNGIRVTLQLKDGPSVAGEPWIVIASGETGSVMLDGEDGSRFALDVTALSGG